MDPLQGALTKAGMREVSQAVRGFLSAVLGEPARELGLLVKDSISSRRYLNLIRVVAKARDLLQSERISPEQVPLKILHPLLEHCSLEENESMQDAWASLLANAADPARSAHVLVAFPEILKQLSPKDASFVNGLYDLTKNRTRGTQRRRSSDRVSVEKVDLGTFDSLFKVYNSLGLKHATVDRWSSADKTKLDEDRSLAVRDCAVIENNLRRLQLLSRFVTRRSSKEDSEEHFFLTALALEFIAACRRAPPDQNTMKGGSLS